MRPTIGLLYRRVSTQEQAKGRNGLEGQSTALITFCEREGITPLMDLEETASGGIGLEGRPVLARAFELARKAKACVLVSKLDRLSREVQLIATLMNGAVPFYTAEDGLECPPMVLHTKAMIAEHERKMIGERTKTALEALKARGVALGSLAHKDPLGTRAKALARAADANRAKADQWASTVGPALRALAASHTLAGVAAELNRLRVPTARGGLWDASTVCRVLKRLDR